MHDVGQLFACKCLNVTIREHPTTQELPSEWPADPNWHALYVGNDGITIAHAQVTSRIRAREMASPDASRSLRWVTLMCLICQSAIYRVGQSCLNDTEKDMVAVPPEGWVEQEPMQSPSGWIQVQKECLTGDAIERARSTTDFSPLFSVVLPPPSSLPPSPKPVIERLTPVTTSSPQPPKQYLPELTSLFPPPPFSPSHPVFVHLSSLAASHSDKLRADAENAICQFVLSKVADLEQAESGLKFQVQCIWKTYLLGVEQVRQRSGIPPPSNSNPIRGRDSVSRNETGPSVAIRDFVPSATPPTRPISSSVSRRVSTLSQSLATSTFHHPKAQSSEIGTKADDAASAASMTTASSRTLVAGAPTIEDGGVLRFSRNTNDTINTAATYRYFMNLEEEIARKKQEQGEKKDEKPSLPGTSQKTDLPEKQSNDKKPVVTSEVQVEDTKEVESRANDKGKRKVTFVQPEPVEIINTDLTAEAADENSVEVSDPSADMVFAMEEGNEIPSVVEGSSSVLPLIEPPSSRPPRPRTRANVLAGGLPESFAALRPASLPLPSHIRPPRSHQGVDSSSSQAAMLSPPPRASNSNKPKAPPTLPDIPSSAPSDGAHVVTRRLRKSFDDMVQEEEEAHFNGDRSNDFFVGSMPMSIRQPQAQKPSLSLASYQPTAAIASEEPAAAPPTRTESATAARKASYAERDRLRSMDPGELDFKTSDSDGEDDNAANKLNGAREVTLEIIKARNQVPEEGMWRSLAS